MWIGAAISYITIGAVLVVVYPLRDFIAKEVQRVRTFDFLRPTPTPQWKLVVLALLSGIAFALLWPVAIVSWYRHHR